MPQPFPLSDDRRQAGPQSVTRVIRILEALCARPEPISLADLARMLDMPKSSLAALLRGLADEDFVIAADGAWRLGPGAFGLGSALGEARRRFQSSDLVRDGMRRLATRSGETVLFAVRDGAGQSGQAMLTYVDAVESRNTVRFSVSVGDRRPLFCTAAGRMLLATGSPVEADAYLAALRPERLAPATQVDHRALGKAIEAARAAGFAQTIDQAADGVTGTAAPIFDAGGRPIGALVVAAPSLRLHEGLAELARLVKDEAAAISRTLGYRAV